MCKKTFKTTIKELVKNDALKVSQQSRVLCKKKLLKCKVGIVGSLKKRFFQNSMEKLVLYLVLFAISLQKITFYT